MKYFGTTRWLVPRIIVSTQIWCLLITRSLIEQRQQGSLHATCSLVWFSSGSYQPFPNAFWIILVLVIILQVCCLLCRLFFFSKMVGDWTLQICPRTLNPSLTWGGHCIFLQDGERLILGLAPILPTATWIQDYGTLVKVDGQVDWFEMKHWISGCVCVCFLSVLCMNLF